jgi:hypothetical protein
MQNGALYPQQTLVRTISVKESGLEPNNETFFHTPNTTGMDGSSNSRKALKKRLEWPTPVVRDYKDTGTQESMLRAFQNRDSPGVALIVGATLGGKLNPTFPEWLMGWPLGWTDLKPLEMDKSLYVQQQLGNY